MKRREFVTLRRCRPLAACGARAAAGDAVIGYLNLGLPDPPSK
jgi:hypothetical protein